jgi:uncharacterized protein YecT (DUF1311 family)
MRKSLRVAMSAFAILAFLSGCATVGSKRNEKEAPKTQAEMNKIACDENSQYSAEMDKLSDSILKDPVYAKNKTFVSAFKKAQVAWKKYRDATLEARFPGQEKQMKYGSVYDMCSCELSKTLYQNRIAELKVWIDGTEVGDVCSGSVKATKP